jgi:putative integral membrane protein (TIGR02587 family)
MNFGIKLAHKYHVINDASKSFSRNNSSQQREFLISLARAAGGALLFCLPLLMTMEMWEQGFLMNPFRLALFLIVALPLLTGLSWYSGFEPTEKLKDDLADAFVAYAVGFCVSAIVLVLLALIDRNTSANRIVTMISLQAVPASIGALLAQSQFGIRTTQEEQKKEDTGYWGVLFLMFAGSVFFAFNLAPTEEIILIGYKMTVWHALTLVMFSLFLMHAFMYSLQFRGQAEFPENLSAGQVFIRYTVVGYTIALLMSMYMLWTFGRTDGLPLAQNIMSIVVLAFPASIGSAAVRLIL